MLIGELAKGNVFRHGRAPLEHCSVVRLGRSPC
jgi:hypothetical protein